MKILEIGKNVNTTKTREGAKNLQHKNRFKILLKTNDAPGAPQLNCDTARDDVAPRIVMHIVSSDSWRNTIQNHPFSVNRL